jgi:rare lipoprotein A (peptidoglycan hydrolase)
MKHSLDRLILHTVCANLLAVTTTVFAVSHYPPPAVERFVPKVHIEVGKASWYGPGFNGRPCADGSRFDQTKLTAAHRSLPLGTEAKVINLKNGKTVKVRITDRGPFSGGRVLDLSKAAADRLDMTHAGIATVQIVADAKVIGS